MILDYIYCSICIAFLSMRNTLHAYIHADRHRSAVGMKVVSLGTTAANVWI